MALSMLVAIVAAPALLGTQEAIRQSQSKEKREEHRARRCNLIASCVKSSLRSREINGRPIVLRDGKLWIDTGTSDGKPYGHHYAGYYLPYPDTKYEGLVTTITDTAPIMNWVYIDRETHEVRYGVRVDAQPNLTGPFDCTRQDRRLTFDGWEGWCAVEEFPTLWALYYDLDDNGLAGKVPEGTRILEIELSRKEKRFQKVGEARQQDQTTQRKVDATQDAPVDEPVTTQPELKTPGVWGVENAAPDQPVPEPPKPFIIPKMNLFQDLPYSVSQVPPPPPTPPPAYSTTAPAPPLIVEPAVPKPQAQRPYTPSDSLAAPAPLRGTPSNRKPTTPLYAGLSGSPPPPTPMDPAIYTPVTPPAPLRAKASNEQQKTPTARPPQGASPNQVTSTKEKRTTPKLNRNSGTRTIAQAQMFEALARGQTPKDGSSRKDSSPPRPASVAASSASEYSNPPQTAVLDRTFDGPNPNILRREPSPPPVPSMYKVEARQEAPIKVSDPAVFGALMAPPESTRPQPEPTRSNSRSNAQAPLQRKGSNRATPVSSAPKAPLPPVPPAARATRLRRESPERDALRSSRPDRMAPSMDRTRTVSPELQRRPSASQRSPTKGASPTVTRTRTESPELKRRPSAAQASSRNFPRNPRPSQTSRYSPPPAPPLPRSGSVSSQQSQSEASAARSSPTPRPLVRTNTTPMPSGRNNITATMTSGTRNRGMALRVGGNESAAGAPRPDRDRTTSSLFREIDDLVSAPNRQGSGTIPANSRADARRDIGRDTDRRPPPLRRAATSRAPLADGYRDDGRERGDRVRDERRNVPRTRLSGERRF